MDSFLTCALQLNENLFLGLMGILKLSNLETKIAVMSRDLYGDLEQKGWYTGFRKCGSLWVAKKKDRMYQVMLPYHWLI